jgi:hypothetical protein
MATHSEARQRREKEIADRYRQINRDLQLGQSDEKIREHARKESTAAAERSVREEKK